MAQAKQVHAKPSAEDIQRLRRLSEEVHSRLAEIGLILVHNGMKISDADALKFAPRAAVMKPGNSTMDGDWVEIIDVDGVEACYGVSGGQPFAESPCGASQMPQ